MSLCGFIDFDEGVLRDETGVLGVVEVVDEITLPVLVGADCLIVAMQFHASRIEKDRVDFAVRIAEVINDFDVRGKREILGMESAGQRLNFNHRHDSLLDV